MSSDVLAPWIGQNFTTVPKARVGMKVSVTLSERCRFTALYVLTGTQATSALTDIVAWDTITGEALCTVSADTSAYQNYIVGLPITKVGGTAIIAVATYGWVQTSGNLIVTPDGTQIGNGLLGDGSVAAKETIMAHASTDGMVDTWATDAGLDIGRSLMDDAPAISNFVLNCPAAGSFF
jgi:hypothetical protein